MITVDRAVISKKNYQISLPLVSLITLLGLCVRLWGIGWSLPDSRHPLATYHPDELVNLNASLAADIPHGQFDIGFYNYGAFDFYLVSLSQTIGRGYGLIPSTPSPPGQSKLEHAIASAPEQAGLFLAGRILSALLGSASILVIFSIGVRLAGRKCGLVAALFTAIAPLSVVHAHFLTVDVPATFFVCLALLWSLRLLEKQSWREYGLAALWCGLAAATKYTAGIVIVAPIVAHILNNNPHACRKHRAAELVVLIVLFLIFFLLACPGPILNLSAFWDGTYPGSGVKYELFEHSRTGHGLLFVNTGGGWWYHLVVSLRYGLGLPLLIAGIAGFFWSIKKRSKVDQVLLAFFLIYYIASGFSAVRFARYMIPIIPLLCIFAARLLLDSTHQLNIRRVGTAAAVFVTIWTGFQSFELDRQMAGKDPRDAAADYLALHSKPEAPVAFATIPWFYSPPLSPLFGAMAAPQRAQSAEMTSRYHLKIPATEWDISVLNPEPDYLVISNIETTHAVDRLKLPAPTAFMKSIPTDMQPVIFGPSDSLGRSIPGEIFPEDLLYILPTVTLYQKR